jgi:cell division protein FtsW
MLFTAGVPWKILLAPVLGAGALGTLLIVTSPYRMARLMTFLDPWKDPSGKGFQILQSLVGFHLGGFWGAGLGNGKEKLFFLPEAHNDFIFAVIGEELGFLGVIGVVGVFLAFFARGLRIAWRARNGLQDGFLFHAAVGLTLAIGIQAFVNMAVVLGLVPTKGLTLPFVSYGGSALLLELVAVGILLGIARARSDGPL